jgi:hypothetical protein
MKRKEQYSVSPMVRVLPDLREINRRRLIQFRLWEEILEYADQCR